MHDWVIMLLWYLTNSSSNLWYYSVIFILICQSTHIFYISLLYHSDYFYLQFQPIHFNILPLRRNFVTRLCMCTSELKKVHSYRHNWRLSSKVIRRITTTSDNHWKEIALSLSWTVRCEQIWFQVYSFYRLYWLGGRMKQATDYGVTIFLRPRGNHRLLHLASTWKYITEAESSKLFDSLRNLIPELTIYRRVMLR